MTLNSEILFDQIPGQQGDVGLITLNRPQALNALSYFMIQQLRQQLQRWQDDVTIKAVMIKANGEKAFCAGGDILALYNASKEQHTTLLKFFNEEYSLNRLIKHYSKPYIALLHGITMGGGVGISIHGSHRVASESFLFAMPETAIGFFPDIGGSYFLPRLPGQLGYYLGLTGARLNQADANYAELIDLCVEKSQFENIIDRVAQTDLNPNPQKAVNNLLTEFTLKEQQAPLSVNRQLIDHCFTETSIENIIHQLDQQNDNFAQKTLSTLLSKSPISLKVTLRQLLTGSKNNFDDCMKMEYRLVQHFLRGQDFYEGIRAVLVDKDNNPKWQPSQLDAITDTEVERYFKALEPDLEF